MFNTCVCTYVHACIIYIHDMVQNNKKDGTKYKLKRDTNI